MYLVRFVDISEFQMSKVQLVSVDTDGYFLTYDQKIFGLKSDSKSWSVGKKDDLVGFYLMDKMFTIVSQLDAYLAGIVPKYKSMLCCNYIEGKSLKFLPDDGFYASPQIIFSQVVVTDEYSRCSVKINVENTEELLPCSQFN